MACKVLAEPSLSAVFMTEDQLGGIGMLVNSAKKRFPYMICPYLHLLSSVCSDKDCSDMVSLKY